MNDVLKRTRSNIFLANTLKRSHYTEHNLKINILQLEKDLNILIVKNPREKIKTSFTNQRRFVETEFGCVSKCVWHEKNIKSMLLFNVFQWFEWACVKNGRKKLKNNHFDAFSKITFKKHHARQYKTNTRLIKKRLVKSKLQRSVI